MSLSRWRVECVDGKRTRDKVITVNPLQTRTFTLILNTQGADVQI